MISTLFVALIFLSLRASSECSDFESCVNFNVTRDHIFVNQSLIFKCSLPDDVNVDTIKIIARKENDSWDVPSTPVDNSTLRASITYVQIQDEAEYYCCRNSCQQEADLSRQLLIHVEEVPPPPEDFHCVSYSMNQLKCYWQEQTNPTHSTDRIWTLTFTNKFHCENDSTNSDGIPQKRKKPGPCNKDGQTVDCIVGHNTVDRLYHLYLSAANMEYNYTVCYNDFIVKLEICEWNVKPISSSEINISWELWQDDFLNGIVCQIDYSSEWGHNSSVQLNGPQKTSYMLVNLQPYTEYNIILQCSVNGSYPGIPQHKTTRTKPDVPFIGPLTTNTSYVKCGKKCVLVYLQEPSAFCAQGNILSYLVEHNGRVTNITRNLTTIRINDYNSGDQVQIFSVNSVGKSKKATTLVLNTNDTECVQIKEVTVEHHNVTCILEGNMTEPQEFVFHKCTENFTVEKICHGKYRFYTSNESNKIFNSSSEDDHFGVSVASPIQSLGIYWQDAEPILESVSTSEMSTATDRKVETSPSPLITQSHSISSISASAKRPLPAPTQKTGVTMTTSTSESVSTSEMSTATDRKVETSPSPLITKSHSISSISASAKRPLPAPTQKTGVTMTTSTSAKKESNVSKGLIPAIVVAALFGVLFILFGGRITWHKIKDTFHSYDIDVPDILQKNDKADTMGTNSSNKTSKETEVKKLSTGSNMSSTDDNNVQITIQRENDDDFTNPDYENIDAKVNLEQQIDESFDINETIVGCSETIDRVHLNENSNDGEFCECNCVDNMKSKKSSIEYSRLTSVMSSDAYSSGDTTYSYSQSEDEDDKDNEHNIDTKDLYVIENRTLEDYSKIANSSSPSSAIYEQWRNESGSSKLFCTKTTSENSVSIFLSDNKDMESMSDYIKAYEMSLYTASTTNPVSKPHTATYTV